MDAPLDLLEVLLRKVLGEELEPLRRELANHQMEEGEALRVMRATLVVLQSRLVLLEERVRLLEEAR